MKNTKNRKPLLIVMSLVVVAIAVTGFYVYRKYDLHRVKTKVTNVARKPHKPDPYHDKVYGHGIDLSHHNATPDWDKLEVDFVFLKATEGTNYVDPTFKARKAECLQHKIPVGAYHFFTGMKNPKSEFENFKKTLSNLDLIPVLDIERKPKSLTTKQYQKKFITFCKEFYKEYGCLPIIYTSEGFYISYLEEPLKENFPQLEPYILWFGDVGQDYKRYINTPSIHQKAITNVKGCKGKVDLNELHTELDNLYWKKTQ